MYWIGGNDLATKGRWVWASNGYRIYPYVNWKAAESPEADVMAMETGIILLMAAVVFVLFFWAHLKYFLTFPACF
jgi:hypothetical protein